MFVTAASYLLYADTFSINRVTTLSDDITNTLDQQLIFGNAGTQFIGLDVHIE